MKRHNKNTHRMQPTRAKKFLGQNFLNNFGIVKRILETAEIKGGETILEIGPGRGVLTRALLDAGAQVIAVEKDNELIPVLEETFKKELESKKLILCNEDILTFNLAECGAKYKVVANIPYYITGQIIRLLLSTNNQPESLVMMVQKEVAKRIVAQDGKESLLSLSVKAYGIPRYIMTVSRGSFNPAPKVDSAILLISNISHTFFKSLPEKVFFDGIHAGFSSKRKKLINNISSLYRKEDLLKTFASLEIPENTRAEDVHLSKWKLLLAQVHNSHAL